MVAEEYRNAPLGDLQTWVRSEVVKSAESQAMGAYRARDGLMTAIWRLDQLHKDGKVRGTCACGKPVEKCRDRSVLTPVLAALTKWEDKELVRLASGKDHGLPAEHPKVMERAGRSFSSLYRKTDRFRR